MSADEPFCPKDRYYRRDRAGKPASYHALLSEGHFPAAGGLRRYVWIAGPLCPGMLILGQCCTSPMRDYPARDLLRAVRYNAYPGLWVDR